MRSEFDILWGERAGSGGQQCPLTDAQLDGVIAQAMQQTPTVGQLTLPKRPSPAKWLAPLALVAGMALLLIPVGKEDGLSPKQMSCNGQRVMFICNHQCTADGVATSLDNFLIKA